MDYGNIIGSLITAGATIGGLWLERKLKERGKPDLSDEDYDDLFGGILEMIREDLSAQRVSYYAFHNGEKTFDGYSLKNLSMMVEKCDEGVPHILPEMQRVPVATLKRIIVSLRDLTAENPIITSFESEKNDKVAELTKSFETNTMVLCKVVNNKKKHPWTGFVAISFKEEKRELTKQQLALLTLQIDRINECISSIK